MKSSNINLSISLFLSMSFIFIIGISIQSPATSSFKEESLPVHLSHNTWLIKPSFNAKDLSEPDPWKNAISKRGLPIKIYEILKEENKGDSLVDHFALKTNFQLNLENLNRPLGLYLAWIGENWEVYINGHLQQAEMYIKNNQISKNRSFRGIIIPLKQKLLKVGENSLVIHIAAMPSPVSIFPNVNAGLLYDSPYVIDSYDNMQNYHNDQINLPLNAIYFFVGLYHLLFFLLRHKDEYNLYFGLFAVFLAIDGFMKMMSIHHVIPDANIVFKIKYISQATLIPSFVLFIHSYFFREQKRSWLLNAALLVGVFFIVAFIITPSSYLEILLKLFQFSVFPILIFGAYLLIKLVVLKKKDSFSLLLSFGILGISAAWDILDDLSFNTGIRLMKYGFFSSVMALTGILANRFLQIYNESEKLNQELIQQKNAFYRFVPVQFLELIGKKSAVDINLGDNSLKTMSILLCDIRAFTKISENFSPEDTFKFLNLYLAQMEPIIHKNNGFVDKFIGDAILALFADYDAAQNPRQFLSADQALKSALQMRLELNNINKFIEKEMNRSPGLDIGIGINSGPLIIGTVGSEERIDTTVIGNTVNLASRLENLNTYYKTKVLLSDHSYKNLSVENKRNIREIDTVLVKGKTLPTKIYEAFGTDDEEIIIKKNEYANMLKRILSLYQGGLFQEALIDLEKYLRLFPEDYIASLYKERCLFWQSRETPQNWSGVFELTHK